MLTAILLFIAILSLLVFVHELGHFIVARKFGVKAEEFGFGIPPRIIGIVKNDQGKWEVVPGKSKKEYKRTILSLNWIPVGGFVKIKGESGEAGQDEDSFVAKTIWKRILIISAGVIMNVILAAVILSAGFIIGLPTVLENLPESARVRDRQIQIFGVLPETPASEAGIESGDTILSLNGNKLIETENLQNYVHEHADEEITMVISRRGEEITYAMSPVILEETGEPGFGVSLADVGLVSYPPHVAVWEGTKSTVVLTGRITAAFYELFKNMIVRQEIAVDLSGPVGIAVITGKVANMGFAYVIQFAALLSINLAIVNFLPFPALDGGRVLFMVVEKIRRKPIDRRVEAIIHNTGFIILLLLLALVTLRDVSRVSDKIIGGLKSLIGM